MADSNVEVLGMYAWYRSTRTNGVQLYRTMSYNGNYTISPVLSMSPYHKEKSAKSEKLNLHSFLPLPLTFFRNILMKKLCGAILALFANVGCMC
jgi:hypothetical protein